MDYLLERDNVIDRRISSFVAAYYMVEAANMTIKQVFPISDRLWGLCYNSGHDDKIVL